MVDLIGGKAPFENAISICKEELLGGEDDAGQVHWSSYGLTQPFDRSRTSVIGFRNSPVMVVM